MVQYDPRKDADVAAATIDRHPNTEFNYMYRDASNYKQYGRVVFAGRPTLPVPEEGTEFLAERLDVQSVRFGGRYEDDPVEHEVWSFEGTFRQPDDDRTIDEFLRLWAEKDDEPVFEFVVDQHVRYFVSVQAANEEAARAAVETYGLDDANQEVKAQHVTLMTGTEDVPNPFDKER